MTNKLLEEAMALFEMNPESTEDGAGKKALERTSNQVAKKQEESQFEIERKQMEKEREEESLLGNKLNSYFYDLFTEIIEEYSLMRKEINAIDDYYSHIDNHYSDLDQEVFELIGKMITRFALQIPCSGIKDFDLERLEKAAVIVESRGKAIIESIQDKFNEERIRGTLQSKEIDTLNKVDAMENVLLLRDVLLSELKLLFNKEITFLKTKAKMLKTWPKFK